MAATPRARYVGSNPRMRGLGLTGLVQDHPTRPGLILIQLDDIGRWERQMMDGLGLDGRGWVPYRRTSWQIIPRDPTDWDNSEQSNG